MMTNRVKGPARRTLLLGLLAVVVTGCSFLNDAVWPSLTGAEPPAVEGAASSQARQPDAELPVSSFDPESFGKALEMSERQLAAVASKLPDYPVRLADVQGGLASQARQLEEISQNNGESDFDRWASAQIELTRLNDELENMDMLREDVANDAAMVAVAVANLTALGQTADIPNAESTRLTQAGQQANAILVRLGRLQEGLAEDHQRWLDYAQTQTNRIGVRQEGTILDPDDQPDMPSTAGSIGGADQTDWPVSGDRFKGRKPLMSVNFLDPEIAYKDQLKDLMQRVQTQYPDIALDIEVVGVDKAEIDSVLRLLAGLNVEAQAYRTMQAPDAPPVMRLFPR